MCSKMLAQACTECVSSVCYRQPITLPKSSQISPASPGFDALASACGGISGVGCGERSRCLVALSLIGQVPSACSHANV